MVDTWPENVGKCHEMTAGSGTYLGLWYVWLAWSILGSHTSYDTFGKNECFICPVSSSNPHTTCCTSHMSHLVLVIICRCQPCLWVSHNHSQPVSTHPHCHTQALLPNRMPKLCLSLLGLYKDHPCAIRAPASGYQRTQEDKKAGLSRVVVWVAEYFQDVLGLPSLPRLPLKAVFDMQYLGVPGLDTESALPVARSPIPKAAAASSSPASRGPSMNYLLRKKRLAKRLARS